jgi:PPOX class probable F420-dependent enzyme
MSEFPIKPFDSDVGRVILHRLEDEEIIWLTTVDGTGCPQPRPVWFHWNGQTVMILSQAQGAKVRHILRHPKVSLNFNTDPGGGDVGVILGDAQISNDPMDPARITEYLRKYQMGIENLGMTFEQMLTGYPVVILVLPTRVRGF